jgi:hypothetical protein
MSDKKLFLKHKVIVANYIEKASDKKERVEID